MALKCTYAIMGRFNGMRNLGLPVLFLIFVISLWELYIFVFKIPEYLLPTPHQIAQTMAAQASLLLRHTGITMFESVFGFAIGSMIGILTAIIFAHFRTVELSVYPYAIALKTIPLVALAPLLVLWFGNGIFAKIIMSALICYFPAIVNTVKGLKAVSTESLDLMESLSATKWQVFKKLRLPTSLPYIFSALKISSTLSVIGAIVGELAGSNQGIGYIILISSYRIETVMVFAAITACSVGGILLFAFINFLENRVLYWQEAEVQEAV